MTCTHPVLDADTNVRWERNGTGFNPQSTPNHDLNVDPTPNTTTLTINVTREEFENKVYTYRCFTFDLNVGLSDPNRVISNEVTVDPPGESVLVYVINKALYSLRPAAAYDYIYHPYLAYIKYVYTAGHVHPSYIDKCRLTLYSWLNILCEHTCVYMLLL